MVYGLNLLIAIQKCFSLIRVDDLPPQYQLEWGGISTILCGAKIYRQNRNCLRRVYFYHYSAL